ncbi:MAG: hypothetical protein AAFO99_10085 [Bacteroidota bacterium]
MKKIVVLLVFITTSFLFLSCENGDDNDEFADYVVARPLKVSMAEFKNGIDVVPPEPLEESGKMYAYQNYIFVNDKYRGIHVIDNSDPRAPQKKYFIKIAGNVDISVKDDYLYADSITDLIVLDISDISNIRIVNRLENVLQNNIVFPLEADFWEYEDIDYENEIVVGWETVTERRRISDYEAQFTDDAFFLADTAAENTTGQGGSLARFKIVNDFLYAVDTHSINVFNIQDLESPQDMEDVYAGFDIETIFHRGQHLFLGSMRGMYIYDISSPAMPTFVSEFQHGTACDPVVVDGDYAFVTLRGGNGCGATESGLFIVDISEITNPFLAESYAMDEPYGLGIKDEKLFVCDGASGLKVYDKTDISDLINLNHFKDIITFDVIPLEETLLMVGDDVLYQYEYAVDNIHLLSTLKLD